jgi:hypothetical protein
VRTRADTVWPRRYSVRQQWLFQALLAFFRTQILPTSNLDPPVFLHMDSPPGLETFTPNHHFVVTGPEGRLHTPLGSKVRRNGPERPATWYRVTAKIDDIQSAKRLRIPNSVNADLIDMRDSTPKIRIAKMQNRLAIVFLH